MISFGMKNFFLSAVVVSFFLPLFASAQFDDSIRIRQQIGTDFVPPTTPGFVNAVPIATDQIDVSWGTSTDDQFFGGYRLFRDAVQIATTSLTSYSDTGLTPSTTYAYSVESFDWLINVSTTSTSTATTTFAVIVPFRPEPEYNTQLTPRMTEISIDTAVRNAVFSWTTNIYTRYVIRWGISSSYEMGFVQSDAFRRSHVTYIEGLSPDTTYQYELIAYNQQGREYSLQTGSFTTTQLPDETAPANVSALQIFAEGTSAYLNWQNPIDADFSKVRVVRNHLFYPQSPVDGFIVYEGSGQSVVDSNVLREYPTQYYTVYTYDALGNVSSGAIGKVSLGDEAGNQDSDLSGTFPENLNGTDENDRLTVDFSDVVFMQNGTVLTNDTDAVVVREDSPITVMLAAELLPRHLKTVTISVSSPTGGTETYILRANAPGSAYEARIAGLSEGVYNTTFTIYDFKLQTEYAFSGDIISARYDDEGNQTVPVISDWTWGELLMTYGFLPFALALLGITWWYLFALRRSREDN